MAVAGFFEPSAWMGGRVSRCLRRNRNEWCKGEVRKHRKAEAHLKWFSGNQMVEPLVDEQRVAWMPFNWSHLGAWRTVHRLSGTDVFWVAVVVCLVPGTGFAHVDLGLDPPGLFLACHRDGLDCFSVKTFGDDWLPFWSLMNCRESVTWSGQIAGPTRRARRSRVVT